MGICRMRGPEGYLGRSPPPPPFLLPGCLSSSPHLLLLSSAPPVSPAPDRSRANKVVCSSLLGMHSDREEAWYMLTHTELCSYLLFPNFFLCMLLLRLSEILCFSIRLKSTNIYLFEAYFMCWVYEGYKGVKN